MKQIEETNQKIQQEEEENIKKEAEEKAKKLIEDNFHLINDDFNTVLTQQENVSKYTKNCDLILLDPDPKWDKKDGNFRDMLRGIISFLADTGTLIVELTSVKLLII